MIEFILGGSGSGKSEIAEQEAVRLFNGREDPGAGNKEKNENADDPAGISGSKIRKGLIYLATMINNGCIANEKIAAHRFRRRDRGFFTIERSHDITGILPVISESFDTGSSTIIIEAVSNLFANEMFPDDKEYYPIDADKLSEKLFSDIENITECFENTVIVSDDIFRDGGRYDESVERYMRGLSVLHKRIASVSDRVIEAAAGNSVIWKDIIA